MEYRAGFLPEHTRVPGTMEVSVVDLPPPWRELWASADSPRSRLHATGGTFTVRAPNSTLAVEAVAHLRTEYRRGLGSASNCSQYGPCAPGLALHM